MLLEDRDHESSREDAARNREAQDREYADRREDARKNGEQEE
jgi:hypothetical protein